MLRNFPNRKMVFCPQAVCKTVVPDEFSVLLSQRRRWINSTIHNLLELVLVRNLCGTFCFSMQFVIFMELIGTVVLPVAIIMTFVLIATIAQGTITSFTSALPLIMLIMVLFSPALLIFITSRKLIYIAWMIVYLLALPVWNFILPVYSYWHFDDFSWGATRMVEGETKGDSHGKAEGEFDSSKVSLKRWEDYERRRRRSVRRRERENQELLDDDQSDRLMYGGGEMGGYGAHQFPDPDAGSARSGSLDLGPEQSNYQYGAGAGQAVDRSYSNQMQFSDAEYTYPQPGYPSQGHPEEDDTDQGGRKPRGPRPMQ
jgi:chitin synthase